jgi:hypothetical protein
MTDFRSDPEYVRLRRQIIRENHPDRGGSDEQLIAALADLDARWSRRSRTREGIRAGFDDVKLPGFVPDDVARQATDLAEHYAEEFIRRTETFQPTLRRARRMTEKVVGSATRSVREHLPKHFPGARRYTDTTRN